MNAKFKNSSLLIVALATSLSGCGGSGVSSNLVATKLAQSYTIEIVEGPAGSNGLEFSKVSPNGTVAGQWFTDNGATCFIYKNGVRTDVTPENPDPRIVSVSDGGTIEGNYEVGDDLHPFSTTGQGFHDIIKPGSYMDVWNAGRDVNGVSHIGLTNLMNDIEGYREKGGVYSPLTATNASSVSVNVSSPSGYAVGAGYYNGIYKVVKFAPNDNVGTPILEDLNGPKVEVVNDLASVGGYISEGAKYFPYVNVNGQTFTLAGLGGAFGEISAINAGNVAVGMAQITGSNSYHPIGWSATDGQVDLTTRVPVTPGFVLGQAHGIDNKGRIVGQGYLNGQSVGFIMTPVNP